MTLRFTEQVAVSHCNNFNFPVITDYYNRRSVCINHFNSSYYYYKTRPFREAKIIITRSSLKLPLLICLSERENSMFTSCITSRK